MLLSGARASVLHGMPGATFGLDILIEADERNVKNLLAAFLDAEACFPGGMGKQRYGEKSGLHHFYSFKEGPYQVRDRGGKGSGYGRCQGHPKQ